MWLEHYGIIIATKIPIRTSCFPFCLRISSFSYPIFPFFLRQQSKLSCEIITYNSIHKLLVLLEHFDTILV